ncbi:MAG: hypothetical protein ATN35_04505 [Epulopiscium sp. Nele67-Bin004]|nr:MAG: hypothetical protein ATN35_04505 [Epulopiscium sp. Nele67-Bin004]
MLIFQLLVIGLDAQDSFHQRNINTPVTWQMFSAKIRKMLSKKSTVDKKAFPNQLLLMFFCLMNPSNENQV